MFNAKDYIEGIETPIGDKEIDYIGMSKLDLEELADNHLNWQTKIKYSFTTTN